MPSSKMMLPREGFRDWLVGSVKLQHTSVNDVCCRLRRVASLIDLAAIGSEEDFRVALIRNVRVRELSPTVRSQLKRAALLHLQFAENLATVKA